LRVEEIGLFRDLVRRWLYPQRAHLD